MSSTDQVLNLMALKTFYKEIDGKIEDISAIQELNDFAFKNYYSAKGTLKIGVLKLVSGCEMTENQFDFDIKLASVIDSSGSPITDIEGIGSVISHGTNDSEGNVSFDILSFNESDIDKTFIYEISERPGDDDLIVYDIHIDSLIAKVIDNGDGTLMIDQKIERVRDEDQPIVNNDDSEWISNLNQPFVWMNKGASGCLAIEKNIPQDCDREEFTFEVTFTPPLGQEITEDLIESLEYTHNSNNNEFNISDKFNIKDNMIDIMENIK